MVYSIQLLRAIAVLMVLFYHTQQMVNVQVGYGESFNNTGAAGVDLFFVISGFVIFFITRKNNPQPSKFFARRLIRIAPLYWLYTSAIVAVLLFSPGLYQHLRFEIIPTICSYLFLLSKSSNGNIGTVLVTGWTLAYEMWFYTLCFIAMLLMPRSPFLFVATVISGGAIVALIMDNKTAFLMVLFNTLPMEFLAGCLIASCYMQKMTLNCGMSFILIVLGVLGLIYSGMAGKVLSEHHLWRALYFGLPAALVVYGFVSIDATGKVNIPRFLISLGDVSYSLYLCHPMILAVIGKIWVFFVMKNTYPAKILLSLGMILSIVGGLMSYWLVEKPMTFALNSAFDRRAAK